jgi:uncharacterized protein YjdB
MANAQQVSNVLNVIWSTAGTDYQNAVPVATPQNLSDLANPILSMPNIANAFINTLVNRIGLTAIEQKSFRNPLAPLKKGTLELGTTVQEVFTNPAQSTGYSMNDFSAILQKATPDTKTAYHVMNRQDRYQVTIYESQLKLAFTSYDNMQAFITSVISSMYNGSYIDEYKLTKKLFSDAVTNNKIIMQIAVAPTDESSAKAITKQIKKLISKFKYPSTAYNKYSSLSGATGNPVQTFTAPEDVVLVIKSDVLNEIDVEVLAVAFNLSKVEFMGNIVEVDDFDNPNLLAVVCDKNFIQVYDNLYQARNQENGGNLAWQYFLHVWQTYSLSPFCNAVALVTSAQPIAGVTSVLVNPDSSSMHKGQTQQFTATTTVTNGAIKDVTWSITGAVSANTKISTTGLLTVDSSETATSITVKATSVADNTKYDTAVVTITAS